LCSSDVFGKFVARDFTLAAVGISDGRRREAKRNPELAD